MRPGKCTGYRFAGAYMERATDSGHPRMQLVGLVDEKVIAKVRQQWGRKRFKALKDSKELRLRYHQHRHLLQWLDAKRTPFRINAPLALEAAAADRERVEADPTLRRQKGAGWKRKWANAQDSELFVSPTEQYNQRVSTIVRLEERDMNSILDEVGGRLHSTLTNVSSVLRPFIYIEGYEHEPLVSLDLANSQP